MNAVLDEIGYTGARVTDEEGSAHAVVREMPAIRRHFLVFASQHTGTEYLQEVRGRFQAQCALLTQQCRTQDLRASLPYKSPEVATDMTAEQDCILSRYKLEIQREHEQSQQRMQRIAESCMLSVHAVAERILEDSRGPILFGISATRRLDDGVVFPPKPVQAFLYSAYLDGMANPAKVTRHEGLGYTVTVTKTGVKTPPLLECTGPHAGHLAMMHFKGGFDPI